MASPAHSSVSIERILSEQDRLRALVRDVAEGEDVVQESILAALRTPPIHAAALRAWLARVSHSLVLRRARAERRRACRERIAARPEALSPPDDLLIRMEAQERVAAAVRRLEEPYRSVILWRYSEERSVAEIAASLGIPESTVRTRLSRALAQLREEMERQYGRDWRAAWLPFLLLERREIGSGVSAAKIGLVAAAALAVVAGALAFPRGASTSAAAAREIPSAGGESASLAALASSDSVRAEAAPSAPASRTAKLRGRAIDDRGKALAHRPLRLVAPVSPLRRAGAASQVELDAAQSSTDGSGAFEVAPLSGASDVTAGSGWVTLFAAPLPPRRRDGELLLVAVPGVTLSGQVVDPSGAPLAGARLSLNSWNLTELLEDVSATAALPLRGATTDASGRFEIADAPGTRQVRIVVQRPGFESFTLPCPESSDAAMEIVLRPRSPESPGLLVRVVDAAGRPIEDATAALGSETARTDPLGLARLPWPDPAEEPALAVAKAGCAPVEVRPYGLERWIADGKPQPLEIRLDAPSRSIAGTAVHADGTPAAGWRIVVLGATGSSTRTDAQGRFLVEGLAPHPYVLRIYDPATLASHVTAPLDPGSEAIVVRIPGDVLRERLCLRVVDRGGAPIAGVTARFLLLASGGPLDRVERSDAPPVSDGGGRLELRLVPRRDTLLVLEGDDITTLFLDAGELASQEEPTVTAGRRCRVRIVPREGAREGSVAMVDEHGEPVAFQQLSEGRFRLLPAWDLKLGPSPVLIVPDTVAALRYLGGPDDGKEDPLLLSPTELRVLRTR